MRFPLRTSRKGGAAAAVAILLLPASLFASDEPVSGRPVPVPQEVESLLVPRTNLLPEADERRLDVSTLTQIDVAPDAAQRGSVMTDASVGSPEGPPTPIEQAKLDAARLAVEASRAAGTLFVTSLPEDTTPATHDELEAMKMQQLRARHSVAPSPDPIAGVGEDLKAVQKTGPSALTPTEEAKLRGEEIPALTIPTAPGQPAVVGDGAPAPVDATPAPVQKEHDHE